MEVQVARVDRFKKQVDFRLAQSQPAHLSGHTHSDRPTPSRRDRSFRPVERTASARQNRAGSRRRPAPARPPSRNRALSSSHSGHPVLPSGNQRDTRRQPDRRGPQNQNRDQNSGRARQPGSQQQRRAGQPAQPAPFKQPQHQGGQQPSRPHRSRSSPAGQTSRSRPRNRPDPSAGRHPRSS